MTRNPQKSDKSVFCLFCPFFWRTGTFCSVLSETCSRNDVEQTRLDDESNHGKILETYRNGLLLGWIFFLLGAFPIALLAYMRISESGYVNHDEMVPPLSPEQDVLLKEAIGMVLGGIFLHLFCGTRSYFRLSRNPEKLCGFIQKFFFCTDVYNDLLRSYLCSVIDEMKRVWKISRCRINPSGSPLLNSVENPEDQNGLGEEGETTEV